MESRSWTDASRTALVADVGRHALRIGLTDADGALLHDSVRTYVASDQPTVSGAISSFGRAAGLRHLPKRLAVAVAGIPRGDTVSVTNGRWRVSRSGLAAMIQAPPLIVNDFAATAWAVSSPDCTGRLEVLGGGGVRPQQPGTYCIIGVGSGLGVAVISRDAYGGVNVTPTEAGNSAFPSGLKDAEPLLDTIGARHGFATSEMLVSAPGFVAIYETVAKRRNVTPIAADPKDIVRIGMSSRDPAVGEAVSLFLKALWHLSANLVLTSGAWDGAILTGSFAAALRAHLERPDLVDHFAMNGLYKHALSTVPRSLIAFRHAELEGAAAALLVEDARRTAAGCA